MGPLSSLSISFLLYFFFFLSGGIMIVTQWALTISWKWISLLGNHVPKVLLMSRHFRRPRVQAWLQKWVCDPGQASRVQNLWASQRHMDCWGLLSSVMNLEPQGPLPHTGWAWSQTVWKADPVDCEKQFWWKSVPLINIPTVWAFEAHEPKTFLFFLSHLVSLPVLWKLKGLRLISSLLGFAAQNKLLYATALHKQ